MRIVSAFLAALLLIPMAAATHSANAGGGSEPASGVVSGTVTYLQRIALPPDATLVVQLRDTSRMDVAAPLIGETRVDSPGQVPIPFEIRYDPKLIDPRFTYSVSARILRGDELLFVSDTANGVITRDRPSTVEIVVRPVP
jgi:putative lipoprotein